MALIIAGTEEASRLPRPAGDDALMVGADDLEPGKAPQPCASLPYRSRRFGCNRTRNGALPSR